MKEEIKDCIDSHLIMAYVMKNHKDISPSEQRKLSSDILISNLKKHKHYGNIKK